MQRSVQPNSSRLANRLAQGDPVGQVACKQRAVYVGVELLGAIAAALLCGLISRISADKKALATEGAAS